MLLARLSNSRFRIEGFWGLGLRAEGFCFLGAFNRSCYDATCCKNRMGPQSALKAPVERVVGLGEFFT